VQLAPRTRLAATIATVAIAIALAAVASGRGCTPVDASPEGTARAFVSAARGGDHRAVWALLGPATQARLTVAARGATDRVGGTRRYAPEDMLRVGARGGWTPSGYRVLEHHDERARVQVDGPDGQADVLDLVRIDGHWRVELPE
jgi:hypothetical protein